MTQYRIKNGANSRYFRAYDATADGFEDSFQVARISFRGDFAAADDANSGTAYLALRIHRFHDNLEDQIGIIINIGRDTQACPRAAG